LFLPETIIESKTFLSPAPALVLETNIACLFCKEAQGDLLDCAMCGRYRIHRLCLKVNIISDAVWYCGNCWNQYLNNRTKHLCQQEVKVPALKAFEKVETEA
jgi:hypothetical protein